MGKDKGLQRLHHSGGQTTIARQVLDPITLGTDGSIYVNSAKLGTPSSVYDADVAWVSRRFGAVSLFFGKLLLEDETKLYSRLELRYPEELFVAHFVENSLEFHAGLKKHLSQLLVPSPELDRDFSKMPANRSHSEWVNFDHKARAGTQASLDFYHLSPSGLARYLKKQGSDGLEMVPRVRVLTTIREMSKLLAVCESMSPEIVAQLPADLRPTADVRNQESL